MMKNSEVELKHNDKHNITFHTLSLRIADINVSVDLGVIDG